jgi:hypothetical protein
MHVGELVELGALVAAHGSRFVQQSRLLNRRHMEQYWLASKCRHDRWFQALKAFERATALEKLQQWARTRSVMEEVLASELLTRIWAAVGCCYDRRHDRDDFTPVVRSALIGHMEARNRVLHALIKQQGFSVEEGVTLNRLRRQTERWTDMLLGYLGSDCEVGEFAFDADRAREFTADLRDEGEAPSCQPVWELTMASLRATYFNSLSPMSPNSELNHRIAASVLACYHSDLFDSLGIIQSHWMLRIAQVADDTQGLVEELLHLDRAAGPRFDFRR